MRKYKLILVVFLVFSLPLFSENESGKIHYLEEVTGEYYDIFGNVDGGVRVMLNSKSGLGRIALAAEKYIRNHEKEIIKKRREKKNNFVKRGGLWK